MEKMERMEMSIEMAKKIFLAKKESAEEERRQELKNKMVPVLNPQALAITVVGFLDAETDAFLACGGTARYAVSEKQMFYLEWYNSQCPTTDLTSLIKEGANGAPVIYDWRNLQVLLTELVEDYKASKALSDVEPTVSLDDVPAHIRSRIEMKIK